MAPIWGRVFWTIYLGFETKIVQAILRIPAFHHGVRRIHRTVEDIRYGRDPHEPLRPGEATENPEKVRADSFFKHFVDEIRNQARGNPSQPPPTPPKPKS